MKRLRKFLALPGSDRRLLIEATLLLGVARACVIAVPFRWTAHWLGTHMTETLRTDLPPEQAATVRRIRWSIALAARHVPWQAVCLPQSIAAKAMLMHRDIPSTLYFGVRKSMNGASPGFDAHAWVRAGAIEVTSGGKPDDFTVVAMFG